MPDLSLATHPQATEISRLIVGLASYFVPDADAEAVKPFLASISPAAIEMLIANPAFAYYTATIESTVVGVAAVRENKHVYHLFVAPELHGQGIARLLWQHAKHQAELTGNSGTFTVNASTFAVPVYERLGFKVASEAAEKNGVRFVPMVYRQA